MAFYSDFSDFLGPRDSRAARQARLWPGHLAAQMGCYLAACAALGPEYIRPLMEIRQAAQAALNDGMIIPSWPEEFWAAAEAAQDGPAQLRALGGFLAPVIVSVTKDGLTAFGRNPSRCSSRAAMRPWTGSYGPKRPVHNNNARASHRCPGKGENHGNF